VEIDSSHGDLVANRALDGRGRGLELFESGSGCVGVGHGL